MHARLNELGCYGLAGAPTSPRELLGEVEVAETLGLGSMFLSERFNIKEVVTLSGAAGAVSSDLGIATGVTNHNTRHPLVTASFATTMHRLTEGRFALGLGRGIAPLQNLYGLTPITSAQMEDFVGLMRRLWHGEMIFNHAGPAGAFPFLHLDATFDEDIPVMLSAFGPKSLELAGRVFDGVILHTFFTDETVVRCVDTVRRAADEAGRDPARVRVWSCFATVGDHIPSEHRLRKTVGRLATYLQGYGDLLVETNRWDPAPLKRFRGDSVVDIKQLNPCIMAMLLVVHLKSPAPAASQIPPPSDVHGTHANIISWQDSATPAPVGCSPAACTGNWRFGPVGGGTEDVLVRRVAFFYMTKMADRNKGDYQGLLLRVFDSSSPLVGPGNPGDGDLVVKLQCLNSAC